MKAFEFQTHVSVNDTLAIPADVAAQIRPEQAVRVLLLVEEPSEDDEWARMTVEQFLKGYDASDAIYDDLSTR